MHIDGLTILLPQAVGKSWEEIFVRCIKTLDANGNKFDLKWMDIETSQAFESVVIRLREQSFLDRLFSSRLNKIVLPIVQHMETVFPYKQICEPTTNPYFAESAKRLRLPIFKAEACQFSLVVHSSLQPYSQLPVIELIFDWLLLNRNRQGITDAANVIAVIASSTYTNIGFGGSLEYWLDAEKFGTLKNTFSNPIKFPAPILVLPKNQRPSSSSTHLGDKDVNHVVFRTSQSFDYQGKIEMKLSPQDTIHDQDENPFISRWTGCSGEFIGPYDGRANAQEHYEKHVLQQKEWSLELMPNTSKYIAQATECLDSTNIYELWQSANSAVIKYDEEKDLLGIAGLADGHIHTFFRPGGAAYVIRKLRTGHWQPPPINGCVPYKTLSDNFDDELKWVVNEYNICLGGAKVDTAACLLSVFEHKDIARLLSSLGYQTQLEYLIHLMRFRYLTENEERMIDELEFAIVEVQAMLETILERLGNDAEKIMVEAFHSAVNRYTSNITQVLSNHDSDEAERLEEVEQLLYLRDQIEYARIAVRSHSWVTDWFTKLDLTEIWDRLALADILLIMNQNLLPKSTDEKSEPCPELFFWRKLQ